MCGTEVKMDWLSALWLHVSRPRISTTILYMYLFVCECVGRGGVCVRARARCYVWLSLTATMGTRFILALIMSERLAMPLSHFSISSILPVRLEYTSCLFPFSVWIASLCLSHLHFALTFFYLCLVVAGVLIDTLKRAICGLLCGCAVEGIMILGDYPHVCVCLDSLVFMFAPLYLIILTKMICGDGTERNHFILSCFCLPGD